MGNAEAKNRNDEGLIEVPPLDTGSGARVVHGLVAALAVTFFLGTPLVDTFANSSAPAPVGDELVLQQHRRDKAKFSDGTLAALIEDDLKDRSVVRRTLSELYTIGVYGVFHEAGGAQAIAGKDRWIFVRQRTLAPKFPTKKILENWTVRLAAMERGLRMMGLRVALLPLPRRSVVHADKLPDDVDPRAQIDFQAPEGLRSQGLEIVDFTSTFHDHEGPPLFYRSDAHWNEIGETLAAEETLRQLGLLRPEEERLTVLQQVGMETQGGKEDRNQDLLRFIGIHSRGLASYLQGDDVPIFKVQSKDGGKPPAFSTDPRVILTGTSFSARRKFAETLEHFGQFQVEDASTMAKGPIAPILDLVKKLPNPRPDLLLAEVPIYTSIESNKIQAQVAEMLTQYPPRDMKVFGPVQLIATPGVKKIVRTMDLNGTSQIVARTRAGAVLSTWDHLVSLRVVVEVLEGKAELRALEGKSGHPVVLDVGEHAVHLALIAPGHHDRPITLRARSRGGPAKMRVLSVNFETALDLKAGEPMQRIAAGVDAGRWSADFEIPALETEPGDLGERALFLGPWVGPRPPGGRIEIQLLDSGGNVQTVTKGVLQRRGWIVTSLGRAGRGEAATLRFTGHSKGKSPLESLTPQLVPLRVP